MRLGFIVVMVSGFWWLSNSAKDGNAAVTSTNNALSNLFGFEHLNRSDVQDSIDEYWETNRPKAFQRTNVVIYWRGEWRIYMMADWIKHGGPPDGGFLTTTNKEGLWKSLKPYRQWEDEP
jgi:hypothetical protein